MDEATQSMQGSEAGAMQMGRSEDDQVHSQTGDAHQGKGGQLFQAAMQTDRSWDNRREDHHQRQYQAPGYCYHLEKEKTLNAMEKGVREERDGWAKIRGVMDSGAVDNVV